MKKRLFAIVLALVLILASSACDSGNAGVNVQRADQLTVSAQSGDRFAGMVVSEDIVKIQKDSNKTVLERYVSVGQKVKEGEKLFSYDSAALEIDLEKLSLEVEKMKNEQTTFADQMDSLQKQLDNTYDDSDRIRLTLEINTLKTKQMENDYQLAAKEKEVTQLQEMLKNVDITAPVDGTIRQIDEEGQSGAYITIQQSGAFKVKGTVNEMSLNNGLMAGARVQVISRLDSTKTWMGTVASIEMQPDSGDENNGGMIGGMNGGMGDGMTNSSSYPFFVELDSTEGLLLGQHVYMEIAVDDQLGGLWVPEHYLTNVTTDEATGEMKANIWVANSQGKLEQRTVQLGMYNEMAASYEIISGLAAEDYVANPDDSGCKSGAEVMYRNASDFSGGETDGTEAPVQEPSDEVTESGTDEIVVERDMENSVENETTGE